MGTAKREAALQEKIEKAKAYIESKDPDWGWADDYGDPGHTKPERGILLANWNHFSRSFLDWLEGIGFELEWSDEWTVTHDHGCKAWRTSPDSYFWEPNVYLLPESCEYLTRDDGVEVWIEELSHDRPRPGMYGCLPSWITAKDLEGEGYELFEGDKETGWHPGQTDDANEVAARAFADKTVERVVFRKIEQSQFYTRWECWVRREESEDGR